MIHIEVPSIRLYVWYYITHHTHDRLSTMMWCFHWFIYFFYHWGSASFDPYVFPSLGECINSCTCSTIRQIHTIQVFFMKVCHIINSGVSTTSIEGSVLMVMFTHSTGNPVPPDPSLSAPSALQFWNSYGMSLENDCHSSVTIM